PVAETPKSAAKKIEASIVEDKAPAKETPKVETPKVETPKAEEPASDQPIATQYQKLTGATPTGQIIDLSKFEKPKKKKEEPKITPNKPGAAGANANKNKRKRIAPKPGGAVIRPAGS